MANVWRNFPSNSLLLGNLYPSGLGQSSHLVADDFFQAPTGAVFSQSASTALTRSSLLSDRLIFSISMQRTMARAASISDRLSLRISVLSSLARSASISKIAELSKIIQYTYAHAATLTATFISGSAGSEGGITASSIMTYAITARFL